MGACGVSKFIKVLKVSLAKRYWPSLIRCTVRRHNFYGFREFTFEVKRPASTAYSDDFQDHSSCLFYKTCPLPDERTGDRNPRDCDGNWQLGDKKMHHYTDCGLDNVWLHNGFTEKKTAYGNAVSVVEADDLHEKLALSLTEKQGRLTGKEFRFLRTMLCLSQGSLAVMMGATEQSVSLWVIKKRPKAVVRSRKYKRRQFARIHK